MFEAEKLSGLCNDCARKGVGHRIKDLPVFVQKTFGEPNRVWVCSKCLVKRGAENNFRKGQENCCARDNYSCTALPSKYDRRKPLRVLPAISSSAKSEYSIPYFAPAKCLCLSCYLVIRKRYLASVGELDDKVLSPTPKKRPRVAEEAKEDEETEDSACPCEVCSVIRKGWSNSLLRKEVAAVAETANTSQFMRDLGFDHTMYRQFRRSVMRELEPETSKIRCDSYSLKTFQGKSFKEIVEDFWEENAMQCPTQGKLVRWIDGKRMEKFKAFVLYSFGEAILSYLRG